MQQLKRIKAWAQFQQLMAYPPVARTQHFVVHRARDDVTTPNPQQCLTPADQGVMVAQGLCMATLIPKRWAKRAVTRNAVRRQIMTAFSNEQNNLMPVPHLVRLQSSFDIKTYNSASSETLKNAVAQEMAQLIKRLVHP
ncbi:MAG: ribonuclease P protein component [Betaproteobacteria bacterium]|jgi:ribonuclease P protein component|nr:ribonuclease P protein component [Betaproteobacteria bacterium]